MPAAGLLLSKGSTMLPEHPPPEVAIALGKWLKFHTSFRGLVGLIALGFVGVVGLIFWLGSLW
jgi:hypothetical protein